MIPMKNLIMVFLLSTLISFMTITGCTSASGYAGTYTCVDDPSNLIILNSDGTIDFINGAGNFTGTYTLKEKELRICANEGEGSTSCISTEIDEDGSFPMGFTKYRK